jgi:hypothetical protein
VRFADFLKAETACRLGFVAAGCDIFCDGLERTSESGNPGVPKTKLPKKLKCTPLDI